MDDDADGSKRRARPSPRPRPAPPTKSGSAPREPTADTAVGTAAAPRPSEPDETAAPNGDRDGAADTDAGSRRRGWWRGRTGSIEPPPTPRHAASLGRAPDTENPAEDIGDDRSSGDPDERAADPADSANSADPADSSGPAGSPPPVDPTATEVAPARSASRPRPAPRVQPPTTEADAPAAQTPPAEPASGEDSPRPGTRSAQPPNLTKFLDASQPQDGDDATERRFSRKRRAENDTDAEGADAHPAAAAASGVAAGAATQAEPSPGGAARPADSAGDEAEQARTVPATDSAATADAGSADAKSDKRRFGRKKRDKDADNADEKKAEDTDEKKTAVDSGGRRRDLVRRFARLAVVLVIIAGAGIALRVYVVQPYYIPSESMEPTLHGCANCNDDHILINKLSYTPQEQDIVVFNRPAGFATPDNVLVKRIVGLPGDTVTLRSGLLYVNGLPITENYLNKKCGANPTKPLVAGKSSWRVPSTDVFVMGDNRCNSEDSRVFGPIPVSSIIGKVIAITWPFSRIGGVG